MRDEVGVGYWSEAGASARAAGKPIDANPFLLSNASSPVSRLPLDVLAQCVAAWAKGWESGAPGIAPNAGGV